MKNPFNIPIMKEKKITILLFSLLFLFIRGFSNENQHSSSNAGKQRIEILSSPDLEELTNKWISGYNNLHPEISLSLSLVPKGETFSLSENMILLSDDDRTSKMQEQDSWSMIIGHRAMVPVINSQNPFLSEIYQKGLTIKELIAIFSKASLWSALSDSQTNKAIKCYLTEDEPWASPITVSQDKNPSDFAAQKVLSSRELILKIQQDPYAIGICSLPDVIDIENNSFVSKISILPIDKNRNGRLDHFENIYATPEKLIRGIWLGKYPRELCRNVYAFASSQPSNESALNFLNWLNNNGQDYLNPTGLYKLSNREKSSNLLALSTPAPQTERVAISSFSGKKWLLTAVLLVVVVAGLFIIRGFKRRKQTAINSEDIESTPAMNENIISAPAGLYYAKSHTWAFMEQDGLVKIGIDDFLQHITGAITQIKTLHTGKFVRKGEKILTIIHDGKQLDLYSPISGVIKKQNQSLKEKPDQVNTFPYTDGWVYRIEPLNWFREIRFLLTIEKYREWLKDEFIRLKDFLATSANSNTVVFNHLILQDGGELTDNVLADLAPEVWEDFQIHFINKSK